MLQYYKTTIKLVRGDTCSLQLNFSQEVETATFSVKKYVTDTDYVIHKNIVDGVLRIEHSDTNDLEPGKYVYDIQVGYGDVIDTPLIGTFEVLADVTRE